MKKILFISVVICSFLAACTDKKKEAAVQYNDAVVQEVDKADSLLQILFDFKMFDAFPQMKESFSAQFQQSEENLKHLKPMEGDDSLRMAALDLLNTYGSILDNEYSAIYEIMKDSVYTQKDSVGVDSLMFIMSGIWDMASQNIVEQQKRFAEKYGITLDNEAVK